MTLGSEGSSTIPAGYTYLGQFVDHDLTFDRTTVALGSAVTPADLLQGRSPTLDLDCLYGNGPGDPVSAAFYSDGLHLKTGRTVRIGSDPGPTSGRPALPVDAVAPTTSPASATRPSSRTSSTTAAR
jgi:hypothetical protein